MEINETYKLTINGYDMNGYGVAKLDNRVIFVEKAMDGEVVIAKITNVHKKYAFAVMIKLLSPSKNRIEPLCPYSQLCGGCDLLHIDYETEKKIKENKVKQALKRREDIIYNPIISSNKIYGYRNKIMIPYVKDEEDDVVYGFYEKKSHKVIPMDKCIISSDLDNKILYFINRYLNIFHISIYNEVTHKGLFREVMIRHTALNEYMVVLIVTDNHDFNDLVQYLIDEFKEIKSIYLNINKENNNVILSNEFKLIYGKATITENILGLKFSVSPQSFMQVNHDQCEKLYEEAFRMANLNKNMNVIDAYCGMGSITLNIAKHVNYVYGIEVVPEAIDNANKNKEINGISNVSFICGKCEDEIVKLANKENIDVVFFDPPRKGCDIKFLNTIISMKIKKIVYISCNIATAARDIEILEKNGYELKEVTPTDLFSKTSHVESVCLLVKKDSK